MRRRYIKNDQRPENTKYNHRTVGMCTMFADVRFIYELRYQNLYYKRSLGAFLDFSYINLCSMKINDVYFHYIKKQVEKNLLIYYNYIKE